MGQPMNDRPHDKQAPAQPGKPTPAPLPPADQKNVPPAGDAPSAADKLTPEEQWELFEKELKENDWGHRPC